MRVAWLTRVLKYSWNGLWRPYAIVRRGEASACDFTATDAAIGVRGGVALKS